MSDEPTPPTHKRPRIDQPRVAPPKKEASVKAPIIKVTKPEWLGDIVIHEGGLSAPAQFASLALGVVSARCGSRSPARALGAHMLRQLWDDWVVGCQRAIVVDVLLKRKEDDGEERKTFPTCAFRFSVSPLLLGIMGGGVQVTSVHLPHIVEKQQWVDENRFIGVDGLTAERPEVRMIDALTGVKTVLRREEGSISHLCANRSWLVNLKSGGKLFVVTPTAAVGVDSGVSVALPHPSYRATFLVLNKVVPSQAVILVKDSEGKRARYFLVVDVAKTYSSRVLEIMGATPFPDDKLDEDWYIETIVVMQNKVGENVFIFSAQETRDHETVVMSVQSNGDARKLYTPRIYLVLDQVSSSLFSVYHANRLDIWDCNDTSKKYPVVKCIPDYMDDANEMTGGGFIVFTEKNHNKLQVIEASSTQVVVSFGIDGWWGVKFVTMKRKEGKKQTVVPFIGSLSHGSQVTVVIALILGFSSLWGYFQELLWKELKFPYGIFAAWLQCWCYVLFSTLHAVLSGSSVKKTVPFWFYSWVAAATFGTRLFGNFAYRFLNYTCKVLFTSSLPLPTMLLGALFLHKPLQAKKIGFALLMIAGLVFFSVADSTISSFDIRGAFLMLGSLTCDATKHLLHETALSGFHAPELEVSFWSSAAGGILVLPVVIYSGQFWPAITLLISQPHYLLAMLPMFLFAYLTTLITLSLTSLCDAVVASIVVAVRKAVTIALSFVLFPKPLVPGHIVDPNHQQQPFIMSDAVLRVSRVVWESVVCPGWLDPRGTPTSRIRDDSHHLFRLAEAMFPLVALVCKRALSRPSAPSPGSSYAAITSAAAAPAPSCVAWIVNRRHNQQHPGASGGLGRAVKEVAAALLGLCIGGHVGAARRFLGEGDADAGAGGGTLPGLWDGRRVIAGWGVDNVEGGGGGTRLVRDSVREYVRASCGKQLVCMKSYMSMGFLDRVFAAGHLEVIRWLVSWLGIGVGEAQWLLYRPLCAAMDHGNVEVVKWVFKEFNLVELLPSCAVEILRMFSKYSNRTSPLHYRLLYDWINATFPIPPCMDHMVFALLAKKHCTVEDCQWLEGSTNNFVGPYRFNYLLKLVRNSDVAKWILMTYPASHANEGTLNHLCHVTGDVEFAKFLFIDCSPTVATFIAACSTSKKRGASLAKWVSNRVALTQSDVIKSLVQALRAGNIEVADWLDETFHVMDVLNADPEAQTNALSALCEKYKDEVVGIQWFLQHLSRPVTTTNHSIKRVVLQALYASQELLHTMEFASGLECSEEIVVAFMRKGLKALQWLLLFRDSVSPSLTPEFLASCLCSPCFRPLSSKVIKWVICTFNLQYQHIKSGNNHLLHSLLVNGKNRCAQWLLGTLNIPLDDVLLIIELHSYWLRCDLAGWQVLLSHYGDSIDATVIRSKLMDVSTSSPHVAIYTMNKFGITLDEIRSHHSGAASCITPVSDETKLWLGFELGVAVD
ncbi:solute carrier family protein [Pelomyxa schiedti]|nr:solute carrier family protein [Pelomyxa schiedti]